MPFGLGFFATAGAGGAAGSFDLLETQVLGSTTASVTFSSLSTYASTYQHLQIRYATRANTSGGVQQVWMQVNADTGSNYRGHVLRGTGSSVVSGSVAQGGTVDIGTTAGNTLASGNFSPGVIDLLDAFETTKYKTARSLSGATEGNQLELRSWLWMNTNAITQIKLQPFADSWLTGSRFSLYGIKAA
jgi:hypothetical protein